MCVRACVHVCTWACVYHTGIGMCACVRVWVHACVHACMHMGMCSPYWDWYILVLGWSYSVCVCTAHRSCGFVHITGEEVEESKFDITMQMYGKKLDKKDFFGKVCLCLCVCTCACVRVCACYVFVCTVTTVYVYAVISWLNVVATINHLHEMKVASRYLREATTEGGIY